MKRKAYGSVDKYLAEQPRKHQVIIRALRKFVKRVAPSLQESVKWGNGCWLKGKVPVSYVYSGPEYVQFGFFGGYDLKDPKKLLHGEGRYVRHAKVYSLADIKTPALVAMLRQSARRMTTSA